MARSCFAARAAKASTFGSVEESSTTACHPLLIILSQHKITSKKSTTKNTTMFRSKKTFGGAVVMGDESIMVSHKEFCTPLTGRSGVVSHVFVSVIFVTVVSQVSWYFQRSSTTKPPMGLRSRCRRSHLQLQPVSQLSPSIFRRPFQRHQGSHPLAFLFIWIKTVTTPSTVATLRRPSSSPPQRLPVEQLPFMIPTPESRSLRLPRGDPWNSSWWKVVATVSCRFC